MPRKLVDMQITYTEDSAEYAHAIYNTLPEILTGRLKRYGELLIKAKSDREAYLEDTTESPTSIKDRKEDVERYLEEVHGCGYDDFCLTGEKKFGNKELKPRPDNVRGKDVYLITAFKGYHGEDEPNVGLVRLFWTLDALKRASAGRRVVVAPYIPYERQDRKDESRVPITFKAIADILETVGATRVLTMDLHAPQEQGFFNLPVDDLTSIALFQGVIEDLKKSGKRVVLVDPDAGSAKRNEYLAKLAGLPTAIVDKTRVEYEAFARAMQGVENIPGSTAVGVDDLIGSGETFFRTAERVRTYEPEQFIAIGAHLIGNPSKIDDSVTGLQKLQECPDIDRVIVSDSNKSSTWGQYQKIEVVPSAELFGNAIFETQTDGSVSRLFPKIKNNHKH